jgi:hypothetical protein
MAVTNYDEIFSVFLDNCRVDNSTLPYDDEGKYSMIHNGIRHYNSKVDSSETKLTYDDLMEQINVQLDDTRLLLLAFCIRYSELENNLIEFEQVWQPFQKEVGQKFYGEQIKGREGTLERTEKRITELLTDLDSGSIMD